MLYIGNRNCVANSLYSYYENLQKDLIIIPDYGSYRLFDDISELLDIINAFENYQYPFMNNFKSYEKN